MCSPRPLLRIVIPLLLHAAYSLPNFALAQPVDSIRADPNAVALRSIWSLRGGGGDRVGNQVAALGDLDGDGRSEFAVHHLRELLWTVYGLDSVLQPRVLWRHPIGSYWPMKTGRITGTGQFTLVLQREVDTVRGSGYYYDFFNIDSGRIDDVPRLTWNSHKDGFDLIETRMHLADLDLDGDDEFIVSTGYIGRPDGITRNGEIWIYAGGPDFQIDSPTVVIRDEKHHGNEFSLHIGRVDADSYPDLVCVTFTGGRIRWGGPDITAWDRPVDREFAIAESRLSLFNADGDSLSDFLWKGGFVHLSTSGKDPYTRAFDQVDADGHFVGGGTSTFVLGPLNDSADRYDMFGVNSALGDNVELIFSGSHMGPDASYDATYSPRADGLGSGPLIRVSTPAGDIDGNGWRDFIAGNETFGDGGLAVVIGGGPYIPRDSMPASAIRDITIDNRNAAVSVWPNPATNIVHIAWRGDLGRTPDVFIVHDALGRVVARGDADHVRGEVRWHCAQRPAGIYLVTIRDRANAILATATVVKH